MQVAEERKIHAFGQAFSQITAGPNAQLSAIVDTWGPYYIKEVKAAMDGSWKGGQQSWDGMAQGILEMAPFTNMPDDVKAMAEKTVAGIKDGSIKPFTGPLKKQDGTDWLKAGESSDDGTLLGMNFYVEGVDDKLPQPHVVHAAEAGIFEQSEVRVLQASRLRRSTHQLLCQL